MKPPSKLQRRRPGRQNRIRIVILTALTGLLGVHMFAWYVLGWRVLGKFSLSGFVSLAVAHINMAAAFCAALLVGAIFSGRLFCGYVCKFSALQEATEWIYRRVGFRPLLIHTRARVVRLFLFVPYLLPVLYVWRDVGFSTAYVDLARVQPYTTDLPRTAATAAFYFVTITLVLTAAFGRRAFCRLVCPFAVFFGAFDHLPWMPRVVQKARCVGCDACARACPMGIDVPSEVLGAGRVTDLECIRCMVCVDVCPVKALGYGRPNARLPVQQPGLEPAVRESAFPPWFDVVLAVLAAAGGVWTATRLTGFHVFLGSSWGLIAGVLAWRAVGGLRAGAARRKERSCDAE